MKSRDIFAYLFLAFAWGLSLLVLLRVVHAFGWVGAVTFRAFIASATLILLALVTRRKLNFDAGWKPFAIMGATTVAGQLIGLSLATPRIGAAMTAIMTATIPLFAMVISHYWKLERIDLQRFIGLLIGFIGIIILVGFPSTPVTDTFILGCILALFSTLSAAFGSTYASKYLKGTGSWETTIGAFLFGGAISFPLLIISPVPTTPSLLDYFSLLVIGIVMSALTYITYFKLITRIGPTKAVSVEFAVTLVGIFSGAILLQEDISLLQVLGGFIILCGCSLVLGITPWDRHPSVDKTIPKP